jgi:hypothetical protein
MKERMSYPFDMSGSAKLAVRVGKHGKALAGTAALSKAHGAKQVGIGTGTVIVA